MTTPSSVQQPAVVRRVLPNGLTVLVQEDHAHPLVAYQAVVRTGSATEGPFMGMGISHVVEHMLFKGTARRAVGAVEKEARGYGGTTQGLTTYDTTSYQVMVNREFWPQAADLLTDALFHSTLDGNEFLKEREVVLRELKLRGDDPEQVMWDRLFESAYHVHPYRVPIIGYESLLRAMTREDIFTYYRTHYIPNNIVIGVVGDVQAEAVIKKIEELTQDVAPGAVPIVALPEEPLPVSPREVAQEADVTSGMVGLAFPSVAVSHGDLYALDLLSWILGGGRGSRLDVALREKGVVHSIGAWNYTPQQPGLFAISMRMDPDQMDRAVQGVLQEISRAQNEPFLQREIEEARQALLRSYFEGRQMVLGQAADVSLNEVLVGDPTFSYRYMEGVRQVTLEDLKRVAQRYLKPEQATTVRLYPKGAMPPEKGRVGGAAEVIKGERVTLKNGLKVVLREDHRIPLVTMQASLWGGVRYETEQNNGISVLTSRMLLRGTRHKNAEQIANLIKEWGLVAAPFSGRNSLGLAMESLNSQMRQAIGLFGELLTDSTFPTEELEKERKILLADIKAKDEDPFPWGIRRLSAQLFSQHPYRLDPAGTLESVSRLKSEDVAKFYEGLRSSRDMVVSVVGDFKREEMISLLEGALGKLGAHESAAPLVPQEPGLAQIKEYEEKTTRQEGLVMIGFPGLKVSDPNVPTLDLLEAVLSGGAGRLFSEVREQRGLAYTVGAFSMHGVDPGAFVLYAVTEPANVDAVRKVLIEQLQQMTTTLVPADELDQARQGLLGGRRIARQAQAALVAQMSLDELYGLGYDFPERYENQIKGIGSEQVRAIAQKLFGPMKYVVVIGRPSSNVPPAESSEYVEGSSVGSVH